MSVSLSTDIIMDVARAADPQEVSKARERLAAMGSGTASPAEFTVTAHARAAPSSAPNGRIESFERFEAFVLQSFLENMMPNDVESVYGGGLAGDYWKSMMAEQLANQMARAGGIGIADRILADHYARAQGKPDHGITSPDLERGAAEARNLTSQAIVHEIQRRIGGSLGQTDQLLTDRKQG